MNAAQAGRLRDILLGAAHPKTCPITGQPYTADEMAEFHHGGAPSVGIKGYERETFDAPEMMEVYLVLPGFEGARELFLDPQGRLFVWSTVRIPAEDCECECGHRLFRNSPPTPPEQCPRHGDGVRELEVYRQVASIGWEIALAPHPLRGVTRRDSVRAGDGVIGVDVPVSAATLPRWAYVVHEGDAIRDVLAEYRAERAKAAA